MLKGLGGNRMEKNKIRTQIDQEVSEKIPFNCQKCIDQALEIIPEEHIIKLNSIIVSYSSKNLKGNLQNVRGLYYGKRTGVKEPYIHLFVKNILGNCPKWVMIFFPIVPRIFLSSVLFHEVGHHYQTISHGYKKEVWEMNANKYSLKMQRRLLCSKGIGRVIYSIRFLFIPIINCFKKK
jgi:hypothetical protein